MTIWRPALTDARTPRYRAIADALETDIARGILRPGQKLPTHRDLADALGVTVGTVTRGYSEAETRGLIKGETGRGTYVKPDAKPDLILTFDKERDPGVVDMSLAFPPYSEDPDIAQAFRDLAKRDDIHLLLQYQPSRGLRRHRRVAAQWVRRFSLNVDEDDILITSGAQHALSVIFGALFQPGDRVLTEPLTYPGIKGAASMFSLRLQSVAMDENGMIPDALEAELSKERVKAIYTAPTIHNPTTAIIPESRRRLIAELAKKHNVLIIEDECYGLTMENKPEPIFNFAPDHTFFVVGVSKTIAAGLRIAYTIAPRRFIGDLALGITHTVWTCSPITSELATYWIETGIADEIMKNRRQETSARNELANQSLDGLGFRSKPESFYIWLELPEPWSGEQLEKACRERGVYVSTAEKFMVGNGPAPRAVRICLTGPRSREQVLKGLDVIAGFLRGIPRWQETIF